MLKGTGVSKRFGGLQALADVDFQANSGETVGLIGPNGSGKTTLFNVVSGLVRTDSGEIVFQGQRIERLGPRRIAAGLNRDGLTALLASQEVLIRLTISSHARLLENGSIAMSGPAAELPADQRVKESYLGL
jgi:ABC-type branched-subunit amino acid transport system ATPase component